MTFKGIKRILESAVYALKGWTFGVSFVPLLLLPLHLKESGRHALLKTLDMQLLHLLHFDMPLPLWYLQREDPLMKGKKHGNDRRPTQLPQ